MLSFTTIGIHRNKILIPIPVFSTLYKRKHLANRLRERVVVPRGFRI